MVTVDLWGANGRLTRIAWCRTRKAARRYVYEEALPDEVQARVCWPGESRVLVRRGIGEPWQVAFEQRDPIETTTTVAASDAAGGA